MNLYGDLSKYGEQFALRSNQRRDSWAIPTAGQESAKQIVEAVEADLKNPELRSLKASI